MKVESIKDHALYGKRHKRGEKYEIKLQADLNVAKKLGFVKECADVVGVVLNGDNKQAEKLFSNHYDTKIAESNAVTPLVFHPTHDEGSEKKPDVEKSQKTEKQRRGRYARRDMTAK